MHLQLATHHNNVKHTLFKLKLITLYIDKVNNIKQLILITK